MAAQSHRPAKERCDRCGELGYDRRSLWMACFYDMTELGIPFTEVAMFGVMLKSAGTDGNYGVPRYKAPPSGWEKTAVQRDLFSLRVCKDCRGDWMVAIRRWFTCGE